MKSFLKTFFAIILTMFVISVSAQQTTIARYIITEASQNGIDITTRLLDQGAYTVFYTSDNDGIVYMANRWPKNGTQSFGLTHSTQDASYDVPYETYKADIFYFDWQYVNDYNPKKGTAKVQFTKIYKP